jgi:hypothetical protein
MSLKQALFETINDAFWTSRSLGQTLAVVHLHKSLENAIEIEGDVAPDTFDPNQFNNVENHFNKIDIVFEEQDGLIYYEYEEKN